MRSATSPPSTALQLSCMFVRRRLATSSHHAEAPALRFKMGSFRPAEAGSATLCSAWNWYRERQRECIQSRAGKILTSLQDRESSRYRRRLEPPRISLLRTRRRRPGVIVGTCYFEPDLFDPAPVGSIRVSQSFRILRQGFRFWLSQGSASCLSFPPPRPSYGVVKAYPATRPTIHRIMASTLTTPEARRPPARSSRREHACPALL